MTVHRTKTINTIDSTVHCYKLSVAYFRPSLTTKSGKNPIGFRKERKKVQGAWKEDLPTQGCTRATKTQFYSTYLKHSIEPV